MKRRIKYLFIAITIIATACGTPNAAMYGTRTVSALTIETIEPIPNRESSPKSNKVMVQTKFLGVSFGENRNSVYNKLSRRGYLMEERGYYTVLDQRFGGIDWDFLQTGFTLDKLAIVAFYNSYETESEANTRFQDIYSRLKEKYGYLLATPDGGGLYYDDSLHNTIMIRVSNEESKSGKKRWYCSLIYYWGKEFEDEKINSFNEI